MASISCGNCGGTHDTVADVRACFQKGPAPGGAGSTLFDDRPEPIEFDEYPDDRYPDDRPPDDRPPDDRAPAGRAPAGRAPAGRPATTKAASTRAAAPRVAGPPVADEAPAMPATRPLPRPATAWAGPHALGRALVVPPGGEVPEPWADAPVVAIDAQRLAPGAVAEVVARWNRRERTVVELSGDLDAAVAAAAVVGVAPWSLEPGFTFEAEQLRTLLTDHAVDARDPAGARYLPAERAVALGARPDDTGAADVVLPDGRPAFVDGGPAQPFALDHPVVPTLALDHRGLQPLAAVAPTADLAPDQLAAVAHAGGAARIIAPAGSGKTRVLTERARHLLGGWGVPSGALCLVAFNVRAAEEMRSRTPDLPRLHVRTLNSLGLAIANGSGPFRARPDGRRLATIDEHEVRRILERLVRFPRRAGTDPVAPWLEALAAVRLGLQDPTAVEEAFDGDVDGFAEVVPAYRAELAKRGVLDYDEQITTAIERLLTEPAARAAAQRACRLLLVDEFQDLAPAHLLLVRLLSAPRFDCFGVGDDDQTIYGYVGADPDWLVRYEHWFPGATSHALEVNYRCAPAVVRAAANVLTRNARRVPKSIHARPGRADEPDDLRIEVTPDPVAATLRTVRRLVDAGVDAHDIAVLSRVNVTLLPVQLGLVDAGVPATTAVDTTLLQRSGVRAALAWLRIASNPSGLQAGTVSDAARRPARGLSRVVEWMGEQRDLDGLRRLAGRLTSVRDTDKVEAFVADVEALAALVARGATSADVLAAVRDQLGLGAAMDTLDRSRRDLDRSAHGDDLAAMIDVAQLHPDPATFGSWLQAQLERARLARDPDQPGVHLATVHKVKGQEWPHVVVHEASQGLLPHRLAADVEEERRVFHVAITRSSVATVVVADAGAPSTFLDELAEPGSPLRLVRSSNRPQATPAPLVPTTPSGDPRLAEALKAWRRERARRDGVPAYVVLTDKAIDDIARRRPAGLADLARCHGIGPTKLERYGDEILAAVQGASG